MFRRITRKSPEPTLTELENQGLITSAQFKVRRALEVEETEDEGPHYYLELDDGSVLFLSGQYLYDYEFPFTKFVIKRHKVKGYVLEVITGGIPLEPEKMAHAFSIKDWRSETLPEDGDIIRDITFDEIMRERRKSA